MRKHLSILLAVCMIIASFCIITPASAADPIAVSPSQLNVQMDTNKGSIRTITEKDGINVLKYTPNTESGDNIVTDGYNVGGRNISSSIYKYAAVDYYYEVPAGVTENLAQNMQLVFWQGKSVPGISNSRTSSAVVPNQWARVTFDLTGMDQIYPADSGGIYKQYHFKPWSGTTYINGNNAVGVMYINNLTFYDALPGTPTVTGVSFACDSVSIEKDASAKMPTITVLGQNNPIQNCNIVMSGHSSQGTYLDNGIIYVAADETATSFTITATSVANPAYSATCTVNVTNPAPRTEFDASNIIVRFGVTSDIHLSGSWNQPRSRAKHAHMINAFQQAAKADGATIDAILINGDLVDAMNSPGNVNGNTSSYGSKAVQNFREINYVAQGLWGAPEGESVNFENTATGFGKGLDDGVRFFYALGNHDEGGKGETSYGTGSGEKMYAAELFAAIICGWQFDISKTNPNYATVTFTEGGNAYVDYINDLIDYNTNPATTVNATDFEAKYGVTLASADAKFDKYYGFDETYSNEDGLLYGNRHMKIGEGNNAIHFVAIELSQSNPSVALLERVVQQSISENPAKPVFVLTHYKASTSMPGYYGGIKDPFKATLEKYPQIVIWGGHSHTFLHTDLAIDSTHGYTQVDSSVGAYASLENLTFEAFKGNGNASNGGKYAFNANTKEDHGFANGCYVEVDSNFNVRIKRFDIYRSFSTEYAEDTTLYTADEFTKYTNRALSEPVNEAVFIREPWDITDIGVKGTNLKDYTAKRATTTEAPAFTASSSVTLTPSIGKVTANLSLDAVDDGMVFAYVAELYKNGTNTLVSRQYLTNNFYKYPNIADIPALTVSIPFGGLEGNTEYQLKVYPVDEFKVCGEAITATATTPKVDGTVYDFTDGRKGYFVDASATPVESYKYEGKDYAVYTTFADAITAGADVIFFIKGDVQVKEVLETNQTKALEIIGMDRDNAILSYSGSISPKFSVTFNNVSLNKTSSGDAGLNFRKITMKLIDVKVPANPLNIFNGDWGSGVQSGTLIISGDTGKINGIYPGPNFSDTANVKGDVNVELGGGTYGDVFAFKNRGTVAGANKIDGNVFLTITGGSFASVIPATTSDKTPIEKNLVTKILGGTFSGNVGTTSATQVKGKEVYIIKEGIFNSITYKKTPGSILIKIPDNEGGIGDPTYDSTGFITSFAITPVDGKNSYVNGVMQNTVTVEDGEEYVITYRTGNSISFDLNGGEGTIPEGITGTTGEVVTTLPDGSGFRKTGYTFGGWGLTPDATTPVSSATVSLEGTVLYAIWNAKVNVTLTLNANGGNCALTSLEVSENEVTTLPVASKAGHIFLGWSENAAATSGEISINSGSTPKTLYAIYKEFDGNVVYIDTTASVNGDGKSPFSPTNDFSNAIKNTPAAGTIFVFQTTTDVSSLNSTAITTHPVVFTATCPATGKTYDAYIGFISSDASPKLSFDITFDMPFFAGWTASFINSRSHKVVFTDKFRNLIAGDSIPGIERKALGAFRIRGGGDNTACVNTYIEFDNLDRFGKYPIYAGTQLANVSGDVNLVINDGTISHTLGLGNDGNNNNTIGGNANLIINGYSATATHTINTNINSIGGAVNLILNNGTSEKVTLNFAGKAGTKGIFKINSAVGGKVMPTATAGQFEITTTKPVIKVNGTKLEKNANNLYTLSGAPDNVYAITYEEITSHTVTFDIGDATGVAPTAITVAEGDSITLPDSTGFEKVGYTFDGWFDADNNPAPTVMGTADITLYAKFTKLPENVVEFTTPDEIPAGERIVVEKKTSIDYTSDIIGFVNDKSVYKNVTVLNTLDIKVFDSSNTQVHTFVGGRRFTIKASLIPELSAGQYLKLVHKKSDSTFELLDLTINEDGSAEFTTSSLSEFSIVLCEADAYYLPKATYNESTGELKLKLYFGGAKVIVGFYGIDIDKSIFNINGITRSINGFVSENYHNPNYATDGYILDEWDTFTSGAVDATTEDVLIAEFSLSVKDPSTFDISKIDDYIHSHEILPADVAFTDREYKDGYYNYSHLGTAENPLAANMKPIVFSPIEVTVTSTPTYEVTGVYTTVREDNVTASADKYAELNVYSGSTLVLTKVIEGPSTNTKNVTFSVQLAEGSYTFTIEKAGYLKHTGTVVVADGGTNSFGTIAPIAGDVVESYTDKYGNGVIDLNDFIRVIRCFDSEASENLKKVCDFNEDNSVSFDAELVILKTNFGAKAE